MPFTSIYYLVFLTIFVVAYFCFRQKFRWIWLLIACSVYYLSFVPIFLLLLVVIIFVNYYLSKWLSKINEEKSGSAMFFIVILNVLILGFFKYFNSLFPGAELDLNLLASISGHTINKLILPIGLSYITFTILSYLIEVKRKTIEPESHLGYFAIYIMFFPKVAQGPIERPQKFLPQLRKNLPLSYDQISSGLKLMLWGFFKKIVIADRLAIYVNAIFNDYETHNGTSLAIATVFFAFQIYADFSGYTDIALGSAKLFGFDLTNNFKRPYFSTSIKEFWDRWHITFSTWLRDYLFLPLSYFIAHSLKKEKYLYVSAEKWIYFIGIIVTFAVCGIWHGVGWNYLVWGSLFGIFLSFSNWTKNLNKTIRNKLKINKTSGYYTAYKMVITFLLILVTWIFFRSDSLHEAIIIIKKIFSTIGIPYLDLKNLAFSCLGIFILLFKDLKDEFFPGKLQLFNNSRLWVRYISYLAAIFLILLFGVFEGDNFIYFQF